MMIKLTKDAIFQHVRQTGFPLWTLCILQQYRRLHIMTYNGDDFSDDDKPAAKIDKSLARLDTILQTFPAETLFTIELKNSKTANGNGVIGPLEFINQTKEEQEQAATIPGNPAALGALPVPAGFVSESYLNGKLEELRAENIRALNDLEFKHRENDFNERVKRKEQELRDLEQELKDVKKKYDSNTGAAAETLSIAIKKIITEFFPALKGGQPQQATIGNTDEATAQQPPDPKYKMVEDFASELYATADEQTIRDIYEQFKRAKNGNHRPTNSPVD